MGTKTTDICIIGGGIIGLAVARELLSHNQNLKILVLDKEHNSSAHASGRNSGVLHAGFYYSPDSLKAQLTRRGNELMHEFIDAQSLPIRKTGKVVVVSSESEITQLEELFKRGKANGVNLERITRKELKGIEPLAETIETALWSPNTSVASPSGVTNELAKEVTRLGGMINYGTLVRSIDSYRLSTNQGEIVASHVINCAGLYADVFAKQSGLNDDYIMMPFKGLYWYAPSLRGSLKSHIYPVPNIQNPFLGVHFTVTVNGDVKVGPTAIPSLWREDYGGLRNFRGSEIAQIMGAYPKFLVSKHHNVPALLKSEIPKYNRKYLLNQAKRLAPNINIEAFNKRGLPGVRAQLLHKQTGRLEMDFIVRGDQDSTHILNAVSPAWTSAFAVAEYVCADLKKRKIV